MSRAQVTAEHQKAAVAVVDAWSDESGGHDLMYPTIMERCIAQALADAEQGERTACIRIVERFSPAGPETGIADARRIIADAIRARGQS